MSKIEWTEKTWNPVAGCTKVSPGCDNCYAERMVPRLQAMGQAKYENGFEVTLHPECLDEPLRRKKPTVFFVCSMGDLFHEDVPDSFIDRVYAVAVLCPQHTFIILTKRAERMAEYWVKKPRPPFIDRAVLIADAAEEFYQVDDIEADEYELQHIYHGVTVCNQAEANYNIPHLLRVPGKRFVSIEPMLGPIDLVPHIFMPDPHGSPADLIPNNAIHQVILGGESGPGARPMHPEWVRLIMEQSKACDIPFYFKQWGEWIEDDYGERTINKENGSMVSRNATMVFADTVKYEPVAIVKRVGKKKAGRLLDGQLYDDLIWREYE